MIYSGKTDIGKRRRDNQDSFDIAETKGAVLLTVCDGMGGAAGGSTASSTAVRTFNEYVTGNFAGAEDIRKLLSDGTAEANRCVYELAQTDAKLEGMGTTLVSAIICTPASDDEAADVSASDVSASDISASDVSESDVSDDTENVTAEAEDVSEAEDASDAEDASETEQSPALRIYGVNIGDSRLYTVTKQGLTQISHDHSFVQYLVDIGQLTEEEAENNPNRNMITRAVGTNREVEADTFVIDVTGDDELWLLLCSDGLTNYLSKDKIVSIITDDALTADEKTSALVKGANEGGGGDNITAVIARCL